MASGWHHSDFMRLARRTCHAAVLTSPGVDELRWLAPVRVGDVISGEAMLSMCQFKARSRDTDNSVRLWNQEKRCAEDDDPRFRACAHITNGYLGAN